MRRLRLNHIVLPVILALLPIDVGAQFYYYVEEQGNLEWKEIHSKTYRVIYPEGIDSLAKQYLTSLESLTAPVSQNLGYLPNGTFKKPLPVILHPYSVRSNGLVSTSPLRMELMTTPPAYKPESTPWMLHLSLHESRHVAQMQFANDGWRKYFKYPFGELSLGAFEMLFCESAYLEGDAVAAETALTGQGRGRSADFLEYIRACFVQGETRDYWQWRYGSIRNYTPDFYKAGYLAMSGLYVNKDFRQWPLPALRKDAAKAFPSVADSLRTVWENDNVRRSPFIPTESLTRQDRDYTEYVGSSDGSEMIYAVKKKLYESPVLVRINPENGEEKKISQFTPYSSSGLASCPSLDRVYWSEDIPDKRWSARFYSDIFYLDSSGKKGRLTREKRYFNPACSEEGDRISVTEYTVDARSNLIILDPLRGDVLDSISAPDSFQLVESVWAGGKVYVSAITPDGFGIYSTPDFKPMLIEQPVKIKEMGSHEGKIYFICDRNGVDELYSLDPSGGKLYQNTSTLNGISDYGWSGGSFYFSALKPDGRMIYRSDSLMDKAVDFCSITDYPLADRLDEVFPEGIEYKDVEISEATAYSKAGHLIHFHSWAPVYFKYDDVNEISMSTFMYDAGLGATAFFQNELGTASGYVAYSAWTLGAGFRNAGHAKFIYSGFYPKIELTADLNEKKASSFGIRDSLDVENDKRYLVMEKMAGDSRPYFSTELKVYVPFDFSSNGWLRGVIPQFKANLGNNRYYYQGSKTSEAEFSLSARAYTMLNRPEGRIYPKFGIGAELGLSAHTGPYALFPCDASAFVYGYLPGWKNHSIKLTASLHDYIGREHQSSYLTFDYAIPFASVDWSALSPYIYLRNFEFDLHARYYHEHNYDKNVNRMGIGASLAAHLGNLLWIPYDTRIGISYLHYYTDSVSLVFSIEL